MLQLPEPDSALLSGLEREFSQTLRSGASYENDPHFVRGTSQGNGTCEIFIDTVDPVGTFDALRPIIEAHRVLERAAAAHRPLPYGDWHSIWPPDNPGLFVDPNEPPPETPSLEGDGSQRGLPQEPAPSSVGACLLLAFIAVCAGFFFFLPRERFVPAAAAALLVFFVVVGLISVARAGRS